MRLKILMAAGASPAPVLDTRLYYRLVAIVQLKQFGTAYIELSRQL